MITVIGGSSAAVTGTTVVANTSLNIAGDGATVTGIKDEDDMASNSATKLATQQSIKAYVDSQVGTVDTLSEILANGNTTGANDIDVDAAQKVQFRDAAIYINSSVDGQLDIVADTEIQIAATTIDINGAIVASGEISAASLDISGDVDIDGTLNVDAIDIDGAVQLDNTLTVGVDDTGYDVKFYGATGGAYMLWDESADDLILAGAAGLSVNSAALVTGVLTTTAQAVFNGGFDGNAKATINTADGLSSDYALIITNGETTAGQNFGLRVRGGSNASDVAFTVETYDNGSDLFRMYGNGQSSFHNGTAALPSITNIGDLNTGIWFPADDKIAASTAGVERFRINDIGGVTFTAAATGHSTFNEGGVDADFRVESSGNANMLFVDASTNRVGIGTSPATVLDVYSTSADADGILRVYLNTATSQPTMQIRQRGEGGSSNTNQGLLIDIAGNNSGEGYILNTSVTNSNINGGVAISPFSVKGIGTFQFRQGGVINENGADSDFRVESDGNANMLFVDASVDSVGIGTNSPSSTFALDISGSLRSQGTAPGLTLYETDASNQQWIVGSYGGVLALRDVTGTTYPFQITTGAPTNSILIQSGGVTVNDNSADQDFRVESDTNANAFHVDALTSIVGINTNDISSYTSSNALVSKGRDFALVGAAASGAISNHIRFWQDSGTAYEIARISTIVGAGQINRGEMEFKVNNGATLRSWLYVNYQGNVVFNEDGNESDFRVESDNDANMLFVDAGNDRIGIMESSPTHTVHQTSETGRRLGQVTEWSGTMFDITNNQARSVTLSGLNNFQAGMIEVWFSWRANGGSEPATSRALYAFYEGNNTVSDITEMEFSGKNIVSGDVVVTGGTDSLIITATNTDWFGGGLTGTSGYYYVKAFGGAAGAALSK